MPSQSIQPGDEFWRVLLERDDSDDDPDTESDSDISSRSTIPEANSDCEDSEPSLSDVPANDTTSHVKEALTFLSSKGLSLSKFIYYVSWGHPACVADSQIRAARTALMHSAELPLILQNWWKPPHSALSRKSRTKAARLIMEEFAAKCLREVLDRELEDISDVLRSDDDMSEEFFTSTAFDKLAREFRMLGPNLWALLRRSAYTEKQERRNKSKDLLGIL
ncbi:hypothetical protein BDN67DRAFT_1045159 [Paxillus ammoniavirescens]|nr:hypothetical protein BDN67DRAFT_1045159 [Paxillus ammoniavirescens]